VAKSKKLAFVTNNASDFWTITHKDTEKPDNEFEDVTVEFKMPSEGTAFELNRDDLTHEKIVQLMVGRALKHSYQPRENESDETIFEAKDLTTSRYPDKKVSFSVQKGEILLSSD
jgi:ABC-type sugar transport system ATPase subunit